MNKRKSYILVKTFGIAIAFLFAASCTINKPEEPARKITVSGSGSVNVDQVILSFTIKTRDIDSENASQINMENSLKVTDSLKEAGIDANDIKELRTTETEKGVKVWVKDESGEWVGKDDYFTVTNNVTAVIKNVAQAKSIKDSVMNKSGNACVLSSVRYNQGDSSSALRQARTLAVQNAQDSANLLAGASGCKIDKVLEITEEKTDIKKSNAKNIVQELMNGALYPVSDGSESVTANVKITYVLMN